MKLLFYIPFLLLPGFCQADTFILKDGGKLEGEVTGEMDGSVLVKTKYGALTINRADIQEQLPAQPAPAPAAVPPAAVEVSSGPRTEPAADIEISTAQPGLVVAAAPKLTFQTIQPDTMTLQLVYLESGVAVATETFDLANTLLLSEGAMSDGTYTEYYPDGGLKTVKTMMSGKANGTLKAYFPSGALQVEAYYLAGTKEGPFKYFTEDGRLLMQASYKNDLLNGWKKEYGPDGTARSEAFYTDGILADPVKPAAVPAPAAEPAPEPGPLITAKVTGLTRGELFAFRLNGKYIGKTRLDKAFNVISQEGKMPDGAVKIYAKDGSLRKELLFENNLLKTLRVYEPDGALKAEYSYVEDKAVKK